MSGILSDVRNSVVYALGRHTDKLGQLQEQTSTGSKINRVSDNPSDAYHILTLDSQISGLDNYISNLNDTIGTLEITSTAIENIMSDFSGIRVTITQITGGVYDESQRDILVEQIDSVLENIVSLANTDYSNQYLFGGTATSTEPYSVEYENGQISRVVYQGSNDVRNVSVAPGIQESAFCIGSELFSLDERGDLEFICSSTGVTQGESTSSIKGYNWLEISEPSAGTYRLTIDDGASYVDVSVPPGDTNTKVTNSETGEVLYLDTTSITSTGVELVNATGTNDIFNTLITIRDVFANERSVADDQIEEMRLEMLNSVDQMYNQLVLGSVSVGSKISFLTNTNEMLNDIQYNAEDERSLIEEADIAQIAIDLTQTETLYQLSLSVVSKIMSMTLLDYL